MALFQFPRPQDQHDLELVELRSQCSQPESFLQVLHGHSSSPVTVDRAEAAVTVNRQENFT